MSKPETTFTAAVHKHLPPGRQDPYWMKNNNIYTAGIWDIWYSGAARDLWVEYKFIELPKRASTPVNLGLSELQIKWGEDRHNEGRNLAVIVGCKEGGVVMLEPMAWEHAWSLDSFNRKLMTRKEIAEWIMKYTMTGRL